MNEAHELSLPLSPVHARPPRVRRQVAGVCARCWETSIQRNAMAGLTDGQSHRASPEEAGSESRKVDHSIDPRLPSCTR